MARIRSIKPEFCSSKDTGALSRPARLFFLQLLTEADDEGRLLWIPRRLCGVLYPHDDDVDGIALEAWGAECAARTMLDFYEVDGTRYVQITNWGKHQRINRPTASKLPAPDSVRSQSEPAQATREASGTAHGGISEDSREERNREGEQGTGKGRGKESSLRSESGPPTGSPPADISAAQQERLKQVTEDAIAAYNTALAKPAGLLPAVLLLTEERKRHVKRCLSVARAICQREYGSERVTPEFWVDYFAAAAADDFHSGRTPGGKGHENWTPDFEFLTQPDIVQRLFERAKSAGDAAGVA